MQLILVGILFSLIIFGIMLVPVADAAVEKLTNTNTQSTLSSKSIVTTIYLDIKEGTKSGTFQIFPKLRSSEGSLSDGVKLYLNDNYITSLNPYQWSGDISKSSWTKSVTVKYDGGKIGSKTYLSSSKTISFDVLKLDSTKTSTKTTSQISQKTQVSTNELQKSSTSTKRTYSEVLQNIESGIKASEYALSDLNLENSEANKKIDSSWGIRWKIWEAHGKAEKDIQFAQSIIDKKQYEYSFHALTGSEYYIFKAKDHLYEILDNLKKAKELEKKYQESLKSCVLFWCNEVKNTYGELDSKIQNLESKLNSLEDKIKKMENSKNSFTQYLYKNEINLKNQKIQKLETVRQQEQIKNEQEQHRL